jgi:hypothetical protein
VVVLTGTSRADFVYGGRAFGALSPGIVDPPLADTGALPAGGGVLAAHLDSFSFMGLVSSGALNAQTMGLGGVATSDASIATFHADLHTLGLNFVANADLIEAHAKVDGNAPLSVLGSAMFTNLVVNGVAVNTQVPANTMVPLGAAGFLVLNEETGSMTATDGNVSVTAVHVHLTGGIEIFLAHVESSVAVVPEPGTWMLLSSGILGLAGFHKLRTRHR